MERGGGGPGDRDLDDLELDFDLPSAARRRRPRGPGASFGEGSGGEGASDELEVPTFQPDDDEQAVEGGGGASGPRSRRPGGSETLSRVLWAIPLIAFAVTIIVVGGGIFALAMALFAVLGLAELFAMTKTSRPLTWVGFIGVAALVAAAYFGTHFQMVLVGLAMFPVMLVFALASGPTKGLTASLAVTVFGVVWIGLPFAHAVLLRELPEHGAGLLVDVLVATFAADTAAYLGGRLFGRHQLAPSISPNKTIEGLVFGFVGGTLGFWFAGLYQDWLGGTDALLMGMAVAAIAPLGDLFESAIKRDLGVKDSGSAFGPHGGVLDRLDAVLFTVVAGYYLAILFVY